MNAAVLAQKGEYNFTISTGAQGTYNLGVIIPPYSFLRAINLCVVTGFTSGGAATIDFGYSQRGGGSASSANAFTSGGAIAIASIAATGLAGYTIEVTANLTFAYEITMRINVADLTAGRIIVLPEFLKSVW